MLGRCRRADHAEVAGVSEFDLQCPPVVVDLRLDTDDVADFQIGFDLLVEVGPEDERNVCAVLGQCHDIRRAFRTGLSDVSDGGLNGDFAPFHRVGDAGHGRERARLRGGRRLLRGGRGLRDQFDVPGSLGFQLEDLLERLRPSTSHSRLTSWFAQSLEELQRFNMACLRLGIVTL